MTDSYLKELLWLQDSREQLKSCSKIVQKRFGRELQKLQEGDLPTNYKPMNSIGSGVMEIRYKAADGQYRLIYIAKFPEAIYVLHFFKKKTQTTSMLDLLVARKRYRSLLNGREK